MGPHESLVRVVRAGHSLSLSWWTLERFGLSPAKWRYRLADRGAPRVFCVSIPKSGTHLLERAVCLYPALYRKVLPTVSDENVGRWNGLDGLLSRVRPGQVIVSHLRFQPGYPRVLAARDARGIFLIRDPHDMVVSQVHYVLKRRDHEWHGLFARQASIKDKLQLAIVGQAESNLPSIGQRLDYFAGWLDAGCLVVRFEELVGPGGGGDRERQSIVVRSIYRHLGVDTDEKQIKSVCDRLFSTDSPTFRKGSIGQWRDLFDAELEALFEEKVGNRADLYGYPRGE